MNELPVPRRIERLLESFGADTEFRDAVIGDLAEEFAIRASEDGVHAARRWYRREALRVAPYLVRDWWRGLRGKDRWYYGRTVVLSGVALYLFDLGTRLAAHGIDPGLRSVWDALREFGDAGLFLFPVLMLVWTLVDGVFGGYVAARLGRRAPLASALALGAACAAFMIVELATHAVGVNARLPWETRIVAIVFGVVNTITLGAGIVAGGVLCATRTAARTGILASGRTSGEGEE